MQQNPLLLACLMLLVLLAGVLLTYLLASGFNLKRIQLAMRCEWRVLRDSVFAEKVGELLASAKKTESR